MRGKLLPAVAVALAVAALSLAFLAGRLSSSPSAKSVAAGAPDKRGPTSAQAELDLRAVAALARVASEPRASATPAPSSAELRAAVREELRQLDVEQRARANPADAPLHETPSYLAGVRIVDDAASAHAWTEAERSQFREVLATLNPPQRLGLMKHLAVAINEGRLELHVEDGSPF